MTDYSNNKSFDGQLLELDDIVYQIISRSNQAKDIYLRPAKVIDLSQKGRIELLILENGKLNSYMDRTANVCKDPQYLVDHWIKSIEDEINTRLPERLQVLRSSTFIEEAVIATNLLNKTTGKELQEDVEI